MLNTGVWAAQAWRSPSTARMRLWAGGWNDRCVRGRSELDGLLLDESFTRALEQQARVGGACMHVL